MVTVVDVRPFGRLKFNDMDRLASVDVDYRQATRKQLTMEQQLSHFLLSRNFPQVSEHMICVL